MMSPISSAAAVSTPELRFQRVSTVKFKDIDNYGRASGYLSRLFHKQFHIRLFEYIDYCRVLLAFKYLLSNQHSIGEIADLTGFTNVAMLSKSFKHHFGVPPVTYRRIMKENPEEFNRNQFP